MKIRQQITGVIAPVFTVFKDDLSFDEYGQRQMFDFLLRTAAINAYFVRSGLGQMFTFDMEDTKMMAKTACEHLSGIAPVLVGCNGIWNRDLKHRPDPDLFIKQAVELSQFAEQVGATGVVHTVPEALLPLPGESEASVIRRYFNTIAEAISIPIFIYQPPFTEPAYQLTPALLAELAEQPRIISAKVSSDRAGYLFDLIQSVKTKDFVFTAGNETVYFAALFAGARAVIGQGCSINPQIVKAVKDCFERRDFEGVLAAQHSTNLLVEKCRNPVDFLKVYAAEKGFRMGRACRQMPRESYLKSPNPLSEQEYLTYKIFLESELAKYPMT